MARIYRYPVLITESHSGLFTGILLEEVYPDFYAASQAELLFHIQDVLRRLWETYPDVSEPDFLDAKVKVFRAQVTPEYQGDDTTYPCAEPITIPVLCVHGHKASGMLVAHLPLWNIHFHYYEENALEKLALNYARSRLAGAAPLGLACYLPAKSHLLTELTIKVKSDAKLKLHRLQGREEEPESIAGAAEPLTARSMRGEHQHACKREQEVKELIAHLRTRRTSVLLIGKPGAGKSAIVMEAARKLERSDIGQDDYLPWQIWVTSAHRIIAGMRYLGQWQERCEELFEELASRGGVLYIDHLLDLVQSGGEGPVDSIAAFMIPYLRRGDLIVVAEATPTELDACRRLLPGFAELFQILKVEPFSDEEAKEVLTEMATIVSRNQHVDFDSALPETIYSLFKRFDPYMAFPGQSISFLLHVFKKASAEHTSTLTHEMIVTAFTRRTGLPDLFLRTERLLDHKEVLEFFKARIIGQERACAAAADVVIRFKAGMNDPGRPVRVLLFCGPTGVGKTALARALCDYFFGSGDDTARLIRLDMSEYSGYDGASRLVTAVDGGPSELIKKMRRQPFSLLLLDEIEKAHPQVFDVLMSVFDEGRLTDPDGRITTFRSAIIIMTSNLGASQQASLGFGEQQIVYEESVMNFFRPEFFNCIDGVVAFNALPHEVILKIAEKELREISEREGIKAHGIRLEWSADVVEHIARAGFDARYGARPLQRTIENGIVIPIARLLAERPEVRGRPLRLVTGADDTVAVLVE